MLGFGAARELQEKLAAQEKRIRELEDELALETTWAEGEIEFWQDQCFEAEAKECQCKPSKPWWRYIIS